MSVRPFVLEKQAFECMKKVRLAEAAVDMHSEKGLFLENQTSYRHFILTKLEEYELIRHKIPDLDV